MTRVRVFLGFSSFVLHVVRPGVRHGGGGPLGPHIALKGTDLRTHVYVTGTLFHSSGLFFFNSRPRLPGIEETRRKSERGRGKWLYFFFFFLRAEIRHRRINNFSLRRGL